jgi:peptidoglycan/xylan/chitin deacetylase (PgdA/CDA1 family)
MFKRTLKAMFCIFLILLSGFLLLYFLFSRPPDRALFIDPVFNLGIKEKVVALTFDDGPSPETTPVVLDILKQFKIKATFFLVGEKIEKNPEIARRIISEGHSIGHHTFHHQRMIFKTPGYIEKDILKMDNLFRKIGYGETDLYRPPFGNKLIILPFVLKKMGKKLITWDVEPKSQYDRDNFSGERIADEVLQQVKPGSIILLHDGWSGVSKKLSLALNKIITHLKNNGYKFVKI